MLEIQRWGGTIEIFNENILEVKGLKKYFPNRKGFFNKIVSFNKGVNGVDFTIKKGESVGLVGESGSGKTTLGRCIVRLYEATEGSIKFNINGQMIDLTIASQREMKRIRKHFQMLFGIWTGFFIRAVFFFTTFYVWLEAHAHVGQIRMLHTSL